MGWTLQKTGPATLGNCKGLRDKGWFSLPGETIVWGEPGAKKGRSGNGILGLTVPRGEGR